jgi:chemotaxis protein CheX
MTATDLGVPAVTADQVVEIARDVWSSFLGMELEPVPDDLAPTGATVTGCVHVSGEWNGSVFLQCSAEHATAAAEAMFMAEPGSLGEDEVGDALGELTNMVGGNVKSLLPEPSRLSIPSVARGESYTVRVPGASLVDAVTLLGPAGPVSISVWEV